MIRPGVFVIGIALVVGGCTGSGPSPASGARGVVVAGPQCPVETEGSPCPDRPIVAELTFTGDDGRSVTARSRGDGRFEIALPPGMYELSGEPLEGAMFCKSQTVVVADGRFTELMYACDTGIR